MSYESFQQEPTSYIIALLFSLLITMVVYGLFPLLFAKFRRSVITKKKYRLICFGVNLILWLVLLALGGGSVLAYVFWSWIFSVVGIKLLIKKGILHDNQNSSAAVSECTSSTDVYFKEDVQKTITTGISGHNTSPKMPSTEAVSEGDQNKTNRFVNKKGFAIVTALLVISVVINCALIVFINTSNEDLRERYETSQRYIERLKSDLNEAENDLNYLSMSAVFVPTVGMKYHHYDCKYLDGMSFHIYNVELAESKGYEPCSECY